MEQLLCSAFWVAVLLTGDAGMAEEVIQEAIKFLDADDLATDALLIFVSTLSLQLNGEEREQAMLPEELRHVTRLPRMPRQCFVLRILLDWPEARCARLLHVEPREISDGVGQAVCELAAMNVALHC